MNTFNLINRNETDSDFILSYTFNRLSGYALIAEGTLLATHNNSKKKWTVAGYRVFTVRVEKFRGHFFEYHIKGARSPYEAIKRFENAMLIESLVQDNYEGSETLVGKLIIQGYCMPEKIKTVRAGKGTTTYYEIY